MQVAPVPADESNRLAAVHQMSLLDASSQGRLGRAVRRIDELFQVPTCTVTVIDRDLERHLARHGLNVCEGDRATSFCGHTLLEDELLIVPDAELDTRFAGNPLTLGPGGIRFYAGAVLRSADGERIGVLCLKDTKPRDFSDLDRRQLLTMARWVETEIGVDLTNWAASDLTSFFQSSSDLCCVASFDGYMLRVNQAFERILGYPMADVTSRPFLDLVHPEDHGPTLAAMSQLANGTSVSGFVNRCRDSKGRDHWIEWAANPLGDRIFATGRDITSVQKQADQLRDRTEVLEQTLDNLPVFVVMAAFDGQVLFVNREFERQFGWTTTDLESVDLLEACYPDPKERQRVVDVMVSGSAAWHDFQTQTRSGELIETSWRNVRLANGNILGLGQDVTERRTAERALASTSRRFEALASEVPVGVFETDMNGRCTYTNRRWQTIAGLGPEEASGEGWVRGIHPEDRAAVFAEWAAAVKENREFRHEFRFQAPDGTVTWVESRAVVSLSDGHPAGYLGTVLDITERRSQRDALIKALAAAEAAAATKSEFLATMSHEIRTPMNGIVGMAQLLQHTDLTPSQAEDVATLSQSAEALLAILNDVLDFSKIEAGRLEVEAIPFDLAATGRDVIKLLAIKAAEQRIGLDFTYPAGAPTRFLGDPSRMRQILLNLVGNALKFTSRGGVKVDVSVSGTAGGGFLVRTAIQDSGIGIPVSAQANLFAKFSQADRSTTRRFGGTGLGLAICRQLVELMGGTIGYESTEGVGTTFWFELVLQAAPTETPGREENRLGSSNQSNTRVLQVLLVDDNAVNRKVASRMLEKLGCRVAMAENGVEAVAAVAAGRFDLVFMDCQMPEMDGYEATQRIRGTGHTVPIIAMTANALAGDRERCLQAGMNDYLTKPVKLDTLQTFLSNWAATEAGTGVVP